MSLEGRVPAKRCCGDAGSYAEDSAAGGGLLQVIAEQWAVCSKTDTQGKKSQKWAQPGVREPEHLHLDWVQRIIFLSGRKRKEHTSHLESKAW